MQGTRARILELVLRSREARIEELCAELGITAAAVRRHLDHLRADGLVDARAVRQATGRPYYAYFPTERANGALPDAYAGLLERMLRSLDGREGAAEAVTAGMAATVASRHREEIPPGADGESLIVHVTESLREEGILERWHAEDDGYHLVNGSCPYRKAAEISRLPCESDRKTIELLLGLDVEQVHRIVDGAPMCEYLVHAATASQGVS